MKIFLRSVRVCAHGVREFPHVEAQLVLAEDLE